MRRRAPSMSNACCREAKEGTLRQPYSCGEVDFDACAGWVGSDRNPGAVPICDPARDGQTQSCPLRLTARAVAAVEALEDPGQLIGGNANSSVRDDHRAFAVSGCNIQLDASTLGCVLDGVVEHDQHQPLDEPRVTHDL